jgi:hypothetical protein
MEYSTFLGIVEPGWWIFGVTVEVLLCLRICIIKSSRSSTPPKHKKGKQKSKFQKMTSREHQKQQGRSGNKDLG